MNRRKKLIKLLHQQLQQNCFKLNEKIDKEIKRIKESKEIELLEKINV